MLSSAMSSEVAFFEFNTAGRENKHRSVQGENLELALLSG